MQNLPAMGVIFVCLCGIGLGPQMVHRAFWKEVSQSDDDDACVSTNILLLPTGILHLFVMFCLLVGLLCF